MNRSPIKRQYIKKKRPSREHPSRPKKVYTLVNTSYTEIYMTLRGQNLLQYPPPLKPNPSLKFSKKYYQFHRKKGHETKDCYALKKKNKKTYNIRIPQQFLKKDPLLEGEGGEVRQQRPALIEVFVILRGSSTNVSGNNNKRMRLRDQVLVTMGQYSSWHEPITFTPTDG
jgi:hypothetical protein